MRRLVPVPRRHARRLRTSRLLTLAFHFDHFLIFVIVVVFKVAEIVIVAVVMRIATTVGVLAFVAPETCRVELGKQTVLGRVSGDDQKRVCSGETR